MKRETDFTPLSSFPRGGTTSWESIEVNKRIPAGVYPVQSGADNNSRDSEQKVRINFVPLPIVIGMSHLISRNDGVFMTSVVSNLIPLRSTK